MNPTIKGIQQDFPAIKHLINRNGCETCIFCSTEFFSTGDGFETNCQHDMYLYSRRTEKCFIFFNLLNYRIRLDLNQNEYNFIIYTQVDRREVFNIELDSLDLLGSEEKLSQKIKLYLTLL